MKSDHTMTILMTTILVISVLGLVTSATAAEKYLWQQVSEEGFGDVTNDYVRALANYTPPGSSTAYLYAGTVNYKRSTPPSFLTDGCEVWRTDGTMNDGTHVWQEVVGPSQTQLPAGFGEGCSEVRWMKVINCSGADLLWVGTTNAISGCEIWVTNGTTWKRANLPGFTNNRNNTATRGVAIFNNTIFVGTLNPNQGAGVWRYNRSLETIDFDTLDTVANRNKWEQVNEPGFGEPEVNVGVGVLETFGASPDHLYAGTWNGTLEQLLDAITAGLDLSAIMNGSQVWRTNGTVNGTGPQMIWEPIDKGGFGDQYNGGILSSVVFNGSLYMGTMNFNNGAQIWRTSDGINWTPVTTVGFKDIAGFKAFGNGYVWCMINYSGMLFVGTMNPILGCQVWRSTSGDPDSFEQVNVNGMNNERKIPLANIFGFPVMGIDQYGIRSFAEYNGKLYLGTASFGAFLDAYIKREMNCSSNFSDYVGCEVWRTDLTNYTPPTINVTKTVWNGTAWVDYLKAHVGNVVRFNITIESNDTINVTNITIVDFLSCSLEYADDATLTLPDGAMQKREPDSTLSIPLFNVTILKWALSDLTIEPGQTMYLEYDAYVVEPGLDVNFLYALGHSELGDYDCGWDYVLICSQPAPSGDATDSGGAVKDVYTTGETVYATGSGFTPNSLVDVYIVNDYKWIGGEDINNYYVYAFELGVPTDQNGTIVPTEIWPNPIPGEYDMFFDANWNGIYDLLSDVVDNPHDPGFIVQAAAPVVTPLGLLALMGLLSIIAMRTLIRKKR